MEEISRDTEGFSGADLQALIYNAHLEVVHEAIASAKSESSDHSSSRRKRGENDIGPVQYTVIGGPAGESDKVMTRAEAEIMQRKLRKIVSNTMRVSGEPNRLTSTAEQKPTIQVGSSFVFISISLLIHTTRQQHEIHEEHVRNVLKTTRPSVPVHERERLRRMYVESDLDPSSSFLTSALTDIMPLWTTEVASSQSHLAQEE